MAHSFASLLGPLALAGSIQPGPDFPETVTGEDIVVTARPPRCEPLPNDPLDAVTAAAPRGDYYYIVPAADGGYEYLENVDIYGAPDNQVTTMDRWRRAGVNLSSFTFRQPDDGSPMCIGKKPGTPVGYVQLQQQFRAADFRCKAIRVTMFVATREAAAMVWLNGHGRPIVEEFEGNRPWTPVSLNWNPVTHIGEWLQFGIQLKRGDIWVYDVDFETIAEDALSKDQLHDQEICRDKMAKVEQMKIWQPGLLERDLENGS